MARSSVSSSGAVAMSMRLYGQVQIHKVLAQLAELENRIGTFALDLGQRFRDGGGTERRHHEPHVECMLAPVVVRDLAMRIDQTRSMGVVRLRYLNRGERI